jgi:hypothetical protein
VIANRNTLNEKLNEVIGSSISVSAALTMVMLDLTNCTLSRIGASCAHGSKFRLLNQREFPVSLLTRCVNDVSTARNREVEVNIFL